MNNVSVRLVFDRKHVATKKRQSSVQMEVTYQRKRKYVGTGIKLYSDQWGKDLKVKNHPQSLVFNQKLNDMVSGIYDFVYQLSSQNIPFTIQSSFFGLSQNNVCTFHPSSSWRFLSGRACESCQTPLEVPT